MLYIRLLKFLLSFVCSGRCIYSNQGIINCAGTETFAKEPKLAKLLRELKPTPVLHNKKVHCFCRLSVIEN